MSVPAALPWIKKPRVRTTPTQSITIAFAMMILVGASLLNLPFSSVSGESVGFINALFTATSANCVTGLVVVTTAEHWTLFGKIVIIVLIQMGGLGFVTISTMFMQFLHRQVSLQDRMVIQSAFSQERIGGMVNLIRSVVRITLLFEGVGALLLFLWFFFGESLPFVQSLWYGVFHSISAFCNAGFDVIGPDSLIPYVGNPLINIVIMALIVAGGLGFPVWANLIDVNREGRKRRMPLSMRYLRLSIHAKIALWVTGFLLFGGMGMFLLLEWNNPATLAPLPVHAKLFGAMFQSVTLRTCGYVSIDQGGMTEASQFLSCVLMVIGGSPAGTAGGMKTVSFGVILFSLLSVMRGRPRIEAFGRTLRLELLQKALASAMLVLFLVLASTMILVFTERVEGYIPTFLELLFECSSAVGTVGLTAGLTPHLSNIGKIVLTLCMFIGRVGPVTLVMALSLRMQKRGNGIAFPEEQVIVG